MTRPINVRLRKRPMVSAQASRGAGKRDGGRDALAMIHGDLRTVRRARHGQTVGLPTLVHLERSRETSCPDVEAWGDHETQMSQRRANGFFCAIPGVGRKDELE